MAYRRGAPHDAGWSEGRYDYDERNPRERYPPGRMPPGGDYQRTVHRRGMVDRHGDGGYNREFDHYTEGDDYRGYPDDNRSMGHDRRSGPPHKWEDPNYRYQREDHHGPRPEFRESRDGMRRKEFYPPPHVRERSPHKRDSSFYRESPVNRKGSPHSRSGSSNRSYSPEKKKQFSSHQPPNQHSKSKERTSVHSLNTSRDASPPGSTAVPSSKDVVPVPLYDDQSDERKTNMEGNARLLEETPFDRRSEAIALKTKEIEQVYRQDCETFGMVVKMLIDKDPSLEKSVQFALRENLHEIGERCIEELKQFIAEYDARNEEQPVKV